MATGKRYYWIKLKDSFMTSDAVDYMMSQPNGANYVVLYQMLCLKTINTDGRLARQIGEILIPYDVEKIHRDCKWFSEDTIRVALSLYRKFGLVYEDVDGTLVMADHNNLVGSETDWSEKKRRQRLPETESMGTLSPPMSPECPQSVPTNVPIDIRDKEIRRSDIREKDVKKKDDVFASFAADNEPLLKALRDFEKMRKDIGKPLSDRAKTMAISKLQTFPVQDWIPILEQSVFYDWQGLFPLKDKENNTPKETKGAAAVSDILNLRAQYGGDEDE